MSGQTGHPGRTIKLPLVMWLLVCTGTGTSVRAEDCNRNGIDDAQELANGSVLDCNKNGRPDSCDVRGGPFHVDSPVFLPAAGRRSRIIDLEVGDVDHDGILDLVALTDDELRVRLGTGAVEFEPPRRMELPREAERLWLADFNGDGELDALTLHSEPSAIYFCSGSGEGDFAPPRPVAGEDGQLRGAELTWTIDDFTGDGFLDIAIGVSNTSDPWVFLSGAGDGTFAEPREGALLGDVDGLKSADVTGDGRPEIITWDRGRSWIQVLRNLGGGEFSPPLTLESPLESIQELVVGDFDQDGVDEVLLIAEAGMSYLGQLEGERFAELIGWTAEPPTGSAQVVDLNGDGFLDLVTASVQLYFGAGDGTLLRREEDIDHGFSRAVNVVDLDGDGNLDIIGQHDTPDGLSVLLGRPGGTFASGRLLHGAFEDSETRLIDLDGDGVHDFLHLVDFFGRVDSFLRDPEGSLTLAQSLESGGRAGSLRLGDVNGDGHTDLLILVSREEYMQLALGRGDGTFASPVRLNVGGSQVDAMFRDVDADGDLDIVVALSIAELKVLLNSGDGSFTRLITRPLEGQSLRRLFAADFDHDGNLDLLGTRSRSILYLRGSGRGQFFPGQELRTSDATGTDLAGGDLDGDGWLDVVVAAANDRTLLVVRGLPDGQFVMEGSVSPEHFFPTDVVVRDLDRDGVLDIVCSNRFARDSGGNVAYFRGLGGFQFEGARFLGSYTRASSLAFIDLDGSGREELVVGSEAGGSFITYVDRTPEPLESDIDDNGVPDSCDPDCNENGLPDGFDLQQGTAEDCNGNGIPDSCDFDSGVLADEDADGVPDACEAGCRVPGDCNVDGRVDLSDGVCYLSRLFLGGDERFPCGDGAPGHPGNVRLLDWQGDGVVDMSDAVALLTHLFLSGAPHRLAVAGEETTACVPIDSCPLAR